MIHLNKSFRQVCTYRLFIPVLISVFLIVNPFNARNLQAQETQKPTDVKVAVQLSPEQWKAVEGVFQSPSNSEMNVQFTARDKVLVAKLLWNDNEIKLSPETALIFSNPDGAEGRPIRISFIKDSTGYIGLASISVANETWKRVKDYKPAEKIEMAHTPEQLKPYEGLYHLQNANDRFIQFIVKGNSLILKQHWDGNEIPFVPQSELDFFSKVVRLFTLTFTKESDGTISQVLAFKRDRWIRVKKVVPTTEQLKAIEGKYQFKDDPDNYIEIKAKGNNLVIRQLWDNKEIVVEPQTESYFYNNSESYPLQVIKDNTGVIKQVQVLGVDLFDKVN